MKIIDICNLFAPNQNVIIKDEYDIEKYIGSISNIPVNLKNIYIQQLYTGYSMCENFKEYNISILSYLVIKI